ncbi:MAG: Cell division protein FtsH [uncultured Nocardioides sp.]|uniref:Cell division protein FtsH n=1 Tax=uncultured Nocardioides sp. TaxID=198441 RepID=A0A6J4NXU4_9ACTN|nr:MAG: Cell division protein FtsH [uncultured Nocardioides sp.]
MSDTGDQELRASLARLVKQLTKEEDGATQRGTPLLPVLDEHFGSPADEMPVVSERVDVHRWADVDIALESITGRDPHARLLGVGGGDRHHLSLSDLMANAEWGRFRQGQVDRLSVAIGPEAERATVAFGLHLFRYRDEPVLVLQRGHNPQHGGEARIEVITRQPGTASDLLTEIRDLSLVKSVLRGQVISFSGNPYEHSMSGITFSHRPDLPADRVILPTGTLDQVRAHVVGLAEHREQLRAKGQHLKRGILLYGPPGTGKTHTVRHLVGAVPGTTVVLLSGMNLAHVGSAAQIARAHQPAIVVLEDCDLIAEDRDHGHLGGGASPLLFTLLDAMDGLDEDADVVFLLTTNRAEALERALAQRPGRVDLAVEIPLPDQPARRRLLALYAAGVGFSDEALAAAATVSAGTTASYAKELVRRAVLRAAIGEREPEDGDLVAATEELQSNAAALTRALLGSE